MPATGWKPEKQGRPAAALNRQSKFIIANFFLPSQLERELQLARIVGGRGFLAAVPQRVQLIHVVAVDEVERIHRTFQREPVAEGDALGDAKIGENARGSGAGVAAQVTHHRAIEEAGWYQETGRREL